MKILSLAQGFVTNSSSANYWLNHEEMGKTNPQSSPTTTVTATATTATKAIEKETSSSKEKAEIKNETENENQAQKIESNQLEKSSSESENYSQSSIYKENIWEGALILVFFSVIFITVFLIKKFRK